MNLRTRILKFFIRRTTVRVLKRPEGLPEKVYACSDNPAVAKRCLLCNLDDFLYSRDFLFEELLDSHFERHG